MKNSEFSGFQYPSDYDPEGNDYQTYYPSPAPQPTSSGAGTSSGMVRRSPQHAGGPATTAVPSARAMTAAGSAAYACYPHQRMPSADGAGNSNYGSDVGSSVSNPSPAFPRGFSMDMQHPAALPGGLTVQVPAQTHPLAAPGFTDTAIAFTDPTTPSAMNASYGPDGRPGFSQFVSSTPTSFNTPHRPFNPAAQAPYQPPNAGIPMAGIDNSAAPTPPPMAQQGGGMGMFGRWAASFLSDLDDGMAGGGGSGGGVQGGAAQSGAPRPLHQTRFGHPSDDLPLLEELGIFPSHILRKAKAVLNPLKSVPLDAAEDTDLAGPVLFALTLAVLLIMRGKIQFSAVYGLFVCGILFFKALLSLMQSRNGAPLQLVASSIGYALLPTVVLGIVRTFSYWMLSRRAVLPIAFVMIAWSAWCATSLVVKGLGMESQRYLVLYPMVLFYSLFDALTIF